jgi:hypothetical protein
MEQDPALVAPTSIVFISLFWIVLGTFILSIFSGYLSASSYYSLLGVIPLMIGIFLIMMGWGLLTCGKWAFYSALVLSLIGFLISTIPLTSTVFMWFSYSYEPFDIGLVLQESYPLLFFMGFAAMVGLLFKNKRYFDKKQ